MKKTLLEGPDAAGSDGSRERYEGMRDIWVSKTRSPPPEFGVTSWHIGYTTPCADGHTVSDQTTRLKGFTEV